MRTRCSLDVRQDGCGLRYAGKARQEFERAYGMIEMQIAMTAEEQHASEMLQELELSYRVVLNREG